MYICIANILLLSYMYVRNELYVHMHINSYSELCIVSYGKPIHVDRANCTYTHRVNYTNICECVC